MSSSKSLSISDLFFTSPCPNIWLLLRLPMFSDQACQMSLIFGLGLTLFHSGISFLHVGIEVLRHFSCFWASATAVEPRSSTEVCLTWGPPCRNRHQCRAPPCQGHLSSDPLGYLSLFIMCCPTCTGQGIQSHHIAPASEGGFPEQVQPPTKGHIKVGVCKHIMSHTIFCLFDKADKGRRKWRLIAVRCVMGEAESWRDGLSSPTLHEKKCRVRN